MTSPRDPDLLIKAFLDEGLDELPDRSFDAVRAALEQTRQWAVIGPWKEPQIMTATRFALIAAAIAVVAVVAIKFLPSSNVGPAPAPTAAPTATVTPTPTPSPSPTPAPSPITMTTSDAIAAIAPGAYFTGEAFQVPFNFTVPSGWEGNEAGPFAVFMDRSEGPNLSMVVLGSVYADPCHVDQGFVTPPVGPSASDLASALAQLPNATASSVTDGTVGGFPAKLMSLAAPADLSGCTAVEGDNWSAWQLPLGAQNTLAAGHSEQLWIIDAPHGKQLVVYSNDFDGLNSADKAQVQAIVDSIQIEP